MRKRIKKIGNSTFETDSVIERFGDKVTKHANLADSAEVQQLEVQSKTHLEDDVGHGNPAIIRTFTFGMNLHSFTEAKPTKQDIFNSHLKGIEIALWRDGMQLMTDVVPRVIFNVEKAQYSVIIGAKPLKGHILRESTKTLKELVTNL